MTFLEHVAAAVLAGRAGITLTHDAAALPLIRNRVVQTSRSWVAAVSPRVTHLGTAASVAPSSIAVLDLREIDHDAEGVANALDTAILILAPKNSSSLSYHGLQPLAGSSSIHVRSDGAGNSAIDSETIAIAEAALESGSAMDLTRRYNDAIDSPMRLPQISLAGPRGAEIRLAPHALVRFDDRAAARACVAAGQILPCDLKLSLPAIAGSRVVFSVHDPVSALAEDLDVKCDWPVSVRGAPEGSDVSIEIPAGAPPCIGLSIHGRAPRITRVCIETGYHGPQSAADDPLASYADPLAAY